MNSSTQQQTQYHRSCGTISTHNNPAQMSEALTDCVHVARLTSLILGCNGLKDNSDPIKLKFHFQLRMEIASHSKWSPHTLSSTTSH